jgi:hypothetical protein
MRLATVRALARATGPRSREARRRATTGAACHDTGLRSPRPGRRGRGGPGRTGAIARVDIDGAEWLATSMADPLELRAALPEEGRGHRAAGVGKGPPFPTARNAGEWPGEDGTHGRRSAIALACPATSSAQRVPAATQRCRIQATMAPCNWVTAEGAGGLITGDSADHYTCVLLRHDGAISAVVGVFPHPTALLRLVGVVLVEAHDELEVSYRRYLPRGFLATVPGSTRNRTTVPGSATRRPRVARRHDADPRSRRRPPRRCPAATWNHRNTRAPRASP